LGVYFGGFILNLNTLGVDFGGSMPLTEAKVKSLKPKAKAYNVSDYDSLFVLVTPKGSKLWKYKFRIDGKE